MALGDLGIAVGVGATLERSYSAAMGSSVKLLDRVGKSVDELQKRAARVQGVRRLQTELGKTQREARAATERAATLGREMRRTAAPTEQMQEALRGARGEAQRLNSRLERQSSALRGQRRALRLAGDAVRDLDARERQLGRTLEQQIRRRNRLQNALARREGALQARSQRRGQLLDAAALGATVFAPITGSVGAAIEFESVMADVRKVINFETPGQFREMGRDILNLSRRIPVVATQIGDIVAAAGQAGIARTELTRFTEDAAKIAVAFDISGAQAGSAMTGLRSIFKLNQDQALALAGAYNHLSNNMDATAADMLNIANRAGSTADLFGLSGQQVGALGATFLALKTPPEVAATGINALLTRLQTADKQTPKFQAALEDIGLSAEGLRDRIREDAQGALLEFLEAVGDADDVSGVLFDLFGQEYVDDITKLVGGLDQYRKALGLASSEEAGAESIQREYEERAKTRANDLQLLRNRFYRLGITVGDIFLPTVGDAVGVLGRMADVGASLAERFPGATKAIVGVTLGLVGMKVAAIAGGYAWTFVSGGIATAKAAALGIGPALGRAGGAIRTFGLAARVGAAATWLFSAALWANPITWVAAAIVGAGVLIWKYWQPLGAFFEGFGAGLLEAFAPLAPVGRVIGTVFSWVGRVFGTVFEWIGSLFTQTEASEEQMVSFGNAGRTVGKVIGGAFRILLKPVEAVVKGIGTVLEWLNLLPDEATDPAQVGDTVARPPGRRGRTRQTAAAAGVALAAATAAPDEGPTPPGAPPTAPGAVFGAAAAAAAPDEAPTPPGAVQKRYSFTVNVYSDSDPDAIAAAVRREIDELMRRDADEAGDAEYDSVS